MTNSFQLASGDWIGLAIFLAVFVANLINAMRRGKVETPTQVPATPPRREPLPTPPIPQRAKTLETATPSRSTYYDPLLGRTPFPPPIIRRKPVPPPVPEQDDPAGLMVKTNKPLYETKVEKVDIDEEVTPLPKFFAAQSSVNPVDSMVWLRDRLNDRTEIQRAIILSEVIQPPLALR